MTVPYLQNVVLTKFSMSEFPENYRWSDFPVCYDLSLCKRYLKALKVMHPNTVQPLRSRSQT